MIARLKGTVVEKDQNGLVVDVGGVGYAVIVSTGDYGSAELNAETSLHIYEHIREDTHDLYGFSNVPSRQFFQQLLSINGVGPKVALGILGAASVPQLQQAIASGDADIFKGVAGVGTKTAQRIVVELKDKLEAIGIGGGPGGASGGAQLSASDPAFQALLGLGYTVSQAAQALAAVPPEVISEQDRVKAALKELKK